MKLPNGYGSVVKLKGGRRKPWAVRISYMEEQEDGTAKRKRKYLAFFMKQDAALHYLSEYNNGHIVKEHQKYSDSPIETNRPYLITNKFGNHYTRAVYHNSNWNTVMQKMNLNHIPHDCRYTFASLADGAGMNEVCKKIIMGHSLANKDGTTFKTGGKQDVTRDVYTEKALPQLLEAVNILPVHFL